MSSVDLLKNQDNFQALRLVNLDTDSFVQRVTELMQSFSLTTIGDSPFQAEIECFHLPYLALVRISTNQTILVKTIPQACGYKLDIPLKGELTCNNNSRSFLPYKSAFLAHPGEPLQIGLRDNGQGTRLLCPIFDPAMVHQQAEKLTAGQCSTSNLRLPSQLSLCTPEGESFLRTLTFLYSEVERGSPALQSPLVAAQFRDATLSTLLYATLPELSSSQESSNQACKPSYIRRAEAYIRACVADPISMTDISKCVGVSSRTLFKGFRQYLNTTPMAYLKARRLECVRRSLLAAEPNCDRIADIALKWGFSNLGHFAADYRQAFGELPSETLKR